MTTVTEDVKEILANADVGMAISGLDPARYQIERRDGSQVKIGNTTMTVRVVEER